MINAKSILLGEQLIKSSNTDNISCNLSCITTAIVTCGKMLRGWSSAFCNLLLELATRVVISAMSLK